MLYSISFYNSDVYFAYFHTTQGAWDRNFAKGEYISKLKHSTSRIERNPLSGEDYKNTGIQEK